MNSWAINKGPRYFTSNEENYKQKLHLNII